MLLSFVRTARCWLIGTVLGACGPTIGDACTADSQCGIGRCLQTDAAPGGACSAPCVIGGERCPTGSVCVRDALARGEPGCLPSCARQSDCRDEYVCKIEKESETPICVGPKGI